MLRHLSVVVADWGVDPPPLAALRQTPPSYVAPPLRPLPLPSLPCREAPSQTQGFWENCELSQWGAAAGTFLVHFGPRNCVLVVTVLVLPLLGILTRSDRSQL